MATNAVTQEQFTADLGKLKTDVATLITTVTDGIAALKKQIADLQAANPGVDFSALDATVNQVDSDVTAATTNLQQPAPPVVEPPATT